MKRVLKLVAGPLLASVALAGTGYAQTDDGTTSDEQVQTSPADTRDRSGTSAASEDTADPNEIVTDTQGTPPGAGDETASSEETEADVDAGTTASTGDESNFGSVISSIQSNSTAASDLASVSGDWDIRIIRVSDLAEGESMEALDNALSQNQAEVDELRSAIEANAAVSGQLEQEQVAVENVVAAETRADNSLVVYVR